MFPAGPSVFNLYFFFPDHVPLAPSPHSPSCSLTAPRRPKHLHLSPGKQHSHVAMMTAWVCVFLFLLILLPINAFSIFLVFYFGCSTLRNIYAPSTPVNWIVRRHPSCLLQCCLFLIIFRYILPAFAFLLRVSSSSIIHLSNNIPLWNATLVFAVECILLCIQWMKRFLVLRSNTVDDC